MKEEESILWDFISLADLRVPSKTTEQTLRKGVKALWRTLRPDRSPARAAADRDLLAAPDVIRDAIVSPPDWGGAAESMEVRAQEAKAAWVLVGAPGSGVEPAIRMWAERHKVPLVEPPSPHDILQGGREWLERLADREDPALAIPQLERCFLRHHDGLELPRRLLALVENPDRRWVLGCSSWAWAYLKQAIEIHAFLPPPSTLDAFDAHRLRRWLPSLIDWRRPLVFQEASNAETIFGSETSAPRGDDEVSLTSLHCIAADSRGLPGVARELWRSSLRTSADGHHEESAASTQERMTIWVEPFEPVLPSVPLGVEEAMVLQAILLHSGMPDSVLKLVTPLSEPRLTESLQRLQAVQLVSRQDSEWEVPLASYPIARALVGREGLLIEDESSP